MAISATTTPDWIHPSPTWLPGIAAGTGVIFVVDPTDGSLWALYATAEPDFRAGSYPQFHGDWFNTGMGF